MFSVLPTSARLPAPRPPTPITAMLRRCLDSAREGTRARPGAGDSGGARAGEIAPGQLEGAGLGVGMEMRVFILRRTNAGTQFFCEIVRNAESPQLCGSFGHGQ